MAILQRQGVKATFFTVADGLNNDPFFVPFYQTAIRNGHEVALHSKSESTFLSNCDVWLSSTSSIHSQHIPASTG